MSYQSALQTLQWSSHIDLEDGVIHEDCLDFEPSQDLINQIKKDWEKFKEQILEIGFDPIEHRKTIFDSVDEGFKKAVSTIIDANLTTFIAALALFIFGSGPIKGFSVTLMIGLFTSMFTAIIITKFQVINYLKWKKDK